MFLPQTDEWECEDSVKESRRRSLLETHTHNLLSDGVIGSLQVSEHLRDYLFGVAPVAHGIKKIHSTLPHTHVALSLHTHTHRRMDVKTKQLIHGSFCNKGVYLQRVDYSVDVGFHSLV